MIPLTPKKRCPPALQTLADVLFWAEAIPLLVISALEGAWWWGAAFVGLTWLVFRGMDRDDNAPDCPVSAPPLKKQP